jgi:hypothetical protein
MPRAEKIVGQRGDTSGPLLASLLEELGSASVFFVRLLRVWLALIALGVALPEPVLADARTEFLIRMLASSDQFRVRTQAALALGSRPSEPAAVRALSSALRDEHPSVRSASAGALELLKDAQALVALRQARKDRDGAVRAAVEHAIKSIERSAAETERASVSDAAGGPASFYVAVGTPSTSLGLPASALRGLRDHVVKQVAGVEGVRIAPENEAQAAAAQVVRSKRLVGYYLDSSITAIEARPGGGLRAAVSVIVGTYPGRAMRVMLSGAATVSGAGVSDAAKLQAVEAAFTGALRRLPQAMQAGLARAE